MRTETVCLASTFISVRILRTLTIISCTSSVCDSARSSTNSESNSGYAAMTIESPLCGRFCHNSSVINGMKGCNKRRAVSKTYSNTGFDRSGSSLIISRYQSQNSCQRRSEEHTSELQSLAYLVCRLLLEKKKTNGDGIKPINKTNTHRRHLTGTPDAGRSPLRPYTQSTPKRQSDLTTCKVSTHTTNLRT